MPRLFPHIARDSNRDKSITARIRYDPTTNTHLSASWMRTGDLDVVGDAQSEMWIGNVVFTPIGSSLTSTFNARFAEWDGSWSWRTGKVSVALGRTEVARPNRDEVYHNVFSMPETRPFDLGMYNSSEDPQRLVFEKTSQIDVFCAIHSEMNRVVLVLPNPWFALSDRRGRFQIGNVPPGTYRLKAWHQRLPAKYVEITIVGDETLNIDLIMGYSDLPKI